MPPKTVKTISDEIFHEYGKLISRSAFNGAIQYGFVITKLKELQSGRLNMKGTIREWQKEQELPRIICHFPLLGKEGD